MNSGGEQTQPFFTGSELYFNHDTSVSRSEFTGTDTVADYGDNSKWGASTIVLGKIHDP